MKKIISVILALALAVLLIGCTRMEKVEAKPTSMFVIVEKAADFYVVYHRETKVMYAISDGGYNDGIFCLLVNADGSPMVYGG